MPSEKDIAIFPVSSVYRFSEYTLEVGSHRLLSADGREVILRPKTYYTLLCLVRNSGRVVSKETLLDEVWADTNVEEGAVAHCILELRHALGDAAANPRYIRTIPRVGYTFLPRVSELIPGPRPTTARQGPPTEAIPKRLTFFGQRRFLVATLSLMILATASGAWLWVRYSRIRWAHDTLIPEVNRLVDEDRLYPAFELIREAERVLPEDPQIQRLRSRITTPRTIVTSPEGAQVWVRDYSDAGGKWSFLGETPIEDAHMPIGPIRFRIRKEGFDPVELGFSVIVLRSPLEFTLEPSGNGPEGMVRVAGGLEELEGQEFQLEDFWLDQYEVTNADYQGFVNAGAYSTPEYWKEPFLKDNQILTWKEAMGELRDKTGRPGPSTWYLGHFADGEDQHPVSGVSWHEAVAYCNFRGKSLPTIYHWRHASVRNDVFSAILRVSNFEGQGVAPVGQFQGLGPYGTYDMAGNLKEWCWNQTGRKRLILGGSWNEPSYMFRLLDAEAPLSRTETHGFRCAQYEKNPSGKVTGPLERGVHAGSTIEPVNDEIYAVIDPLFSYSRGELRAKIEGVVNEDHWRKETITFDAPYSDERVTALLFLPHNVAPPYQAIVYFPGGSALMMESSANLGCDMLMLDFVIRSGRAAVFPIYKGTYQRRVSGEDPLYPYWSKDLGCTIDYLESREDIDKKKLAYLGVSLGAKFGPLLTAINQRFKASVLVAGGYRPWEWEKDSPWNPRNFLSRVEVPTLMLNGRDDFYNPEAAIKAMYDALGVREPDKRLVLFESGHIPPRLPMIKEILDWLDRYLGPVGEPAPALN